MSKEIEAKLDQVLVELAELKEALKPDNYFRKLGMYRPLGYLPASELKQNLTHKEFWDLVEPHMDSLDTFEVPSTFNKYRVDQKWFAFREKEIEPLIADYNRPDDMWDL